MASRLHLLSPSCAAAVALLFNTLPGAALDDTALLKAHGTLLLDDDFNRDEPAPDKESIGNGWTTNSAWRAKGHKQVDLADGAMHVAKHAEADHGVAIFHDVAFQDGAVELRFKLGEGDDLGLDFVDRDLKTVHAGRARYATTSADADFPRAAFQKASRRFSRSAIAGSRCPMRFILETEMDITGGHRDHRG
jgi:hypothetical protein